MIDRKLQQVYTASISLKQSPSLLTIATMIGTYIPIDHSIIKKNIKSNIRTDETGATKNS